MADKLVNLRIFADGRRQAIVAARGIGIADDEQQGVVDRPGRGGRGAEIGFRLVGQGRPAEGEVHVGRAPDIILVDAADAGAQSRRRRTLLGELLGGAIMDHRRGPEVPVPEIDPARHQATAARLQGLDVDRQTVQQPLSGEPGAAKAEEAAAGPDPGVVAEGDHRAGAVGRHDLQQVAMARRDDAFDPGSRGCRRFGRGGDVH